MLELLILVGLAYTVGFVYWREQCRRARENSFDTLRRLNGIFH